MATVTVDMSDADKKKYTKVARRRGISLAELFRRGAQNEADAPDALAASIEETRAALDATDKRK